MRCLPTFPAILAAAAPAAAQPLAQVGCEIYRTAAWDFLICRYSPPGNIDGRPVP